MMDKKPAILIIVFVLLIVASIIATYYRYVVLGDINYETDENVFQQSLLEE